MIRRLVALAAVAAAVIVSVSGCKDEAACRPGTLFIKLTLNAAAEGADQLHIVVTTDVKRETTVSYSGGTQLQVEFPADAYPAGVNADIVVEALKSGVVVATAQQQGFLLPKSCGALSLSFGGGDNSDLSIGDLAGADFTGVDLSATAPDLEGADLFGADLTEGPDMMGPTVLANGEACATSEQCASGYCVDGYCCDSSCEGQCQACDVGSNLGVCVGVNGAPHGARTACSGTGTCAGTCVATTPNVCTYPGAAVTCRDPSCAAAVKTLAEVCDGAGSCPAVSTFNCPSSACNAGGTDCLGSCTNNTECASTPSTPYCNLPEGVCRATKDEGETCSIAGDCTSGFCVDGFCCNVACTGTCQACSLTTGGNKPGICATVTSGQPVTDKGTTRAACNGSGTCKGSCDGTSPTACGYPGSGVDCGTTCSCNDGTNNCACSSSCALAAKTPKKCDGAGACSTQVAVGCAANICNMGATDCGTCAMDVDCGTGRYCDAGNVCRVKKANGAACSNTNGDHECANNHCVGGTCCATTCGGTTPACKADGSKCVCTGSSCGSLTCLNDACCDNSCPSCRDTTGVTNGCGNACAKNCNTVCQSGSCCAAETDSAFCARLGKDCGNVTANDNCGASRTVNCGTCTAPKTCGGGPTPNVCGCTPETNTAFCSRLGKNCTFSGTDNCGNPRNNVSCGLCNTTNPDCNNGVCTCIPNCDPDACSSYTETKCNTTCSGTACPSCGNSCGSPSCVNFCCPSGGDFNTCQCNRPSDGCMAI